MRPLDLKRDVMRWLFFEQIVRSMRGATGAPVSDNPDPEIYNVYTRADPPPPPSEGAAMRIAVAKDTGRDSLVIIPRRGALTRTQANLGLGCPHFATAREGATTLEGFGFDNQLVGTATAATINTTGTLLQRQRRLTLSGTGAAANVSWRHARNTFHRGASIGAGGFNVVLRFGISAATAGNVNSYLACLDSFTGAHGNFSTTNGWSELVGFICTVNGTGNIPGKWMFIHNNVQANPVIVETAMPRPVVGDVYTVKIFCESAGEQIFASIENHTSGLYVEHNTGTSVHIPLPEEGMAAHLMMGNGPSGTAAIGLDFIQASADLT